MVLFMIEFDKQDKIYKAGETVKCKIFMELPEKLRSHRLSVRFLGYAHTEWIKSKTHTKHRQVQTISEKYSGYQELFNHHHTIFGHSDEFVRIIDAGHYNYEASYKLPGNIPIDYSHKNGYIRYAVKVKLDLPFENNIKHKEQFYVRSELDLSRYSHLTEPKQETAQMMFGWLGFRSNPLKLSIILTRKGWAIGETIPVTIEVDNNSNVKINAIRLKLKELITFITLLPHTARKIENNVLNEQYLNVNIEPHKRYSVQTNIYLDPSYDWKIFNVCSIITCNYFLKAIAVSTGWHHNLAANAWITIGTTKPGDTFIASDIQIDEGQTTKIQKQISVASSVANDDIGSNLDSNQAEQEAIKLLKLESRIVKEF